MKEYWQSLTERERLLVTIAGVVLAVFIIVLAVVRPLVVMKIDSRQNLSAAQAQHDRIQGLAIEYKRLDSGASERGSRLERDQPMRVLVAIAARETGVVVTRLQPTEQGGLTLWIDSVSSVAFYAWLKQLDSQFGLSPELVSLQKSGDGTLRAQVQFSGAN
jgi:type II secretory pathway component PulM